VLHVNGFHNLFFLPTLTSNEANLLQIVEPTSRVSLADGFSPVVVKIDPPTAQTLPGRQYAGVVTLDLYHRFLDLPYPSPVVAYDYSPKSAASIVTHVMEPTTTKLTASPSGPVTFNDTITLVARVATQCGKKPQNPESGGAIPITGGVEFDDTWVDLASGRVNVTKLGTIPINNYPDPKDPEDLNIGVLRRCPQSPGDDAVCVTVQLAQGAHAITATYKRDSSYNGSTSQAVNVTVNGNATPSSLSLTSDGKTAQPPKLLKITGKFNDTWQVTSSSPLLGTNLPSGRFDLSDETDGRYLLVFLTSQTPVPQRQTETLTVTVTHNGVPSVTVIPVTITVATTVSAPTTPLSFFSTDQQAPDFQTVNVSYSGGLLTATANTTSGGNWLMASATPSTAAQFGPTAGQVSIGVNPAGLNTGTYTGTVSISAPSASNGPISIPVTLTVSLTKPAVTLQTSVPGLKVVVDGTPVPAPYTVQWTPGSKHTIGAPWGYSPVTDGVRAVWQSWSDGKSISHEVTASESSQTFTANFSLEYELLATAKPVCAGSVAPVENWYAPGSYANVTATPETGYAFSSFTGDVTHSYPQLSLPMTGPKKITANFVCPSGASCPNIFPPKTAASPNPVPPPQGWQRDSVTVALSAVPGSRASIVTNIQYSLSGAQKLAWTTVAGNSASIRITAEGVTTITFFATDNAGNQEDPQTFQVSIDRTPPTLTGLPQGCTLFPADGRLVQVATISGADTLSGLGSVNVTASSSETPTSGLPFQVVSGRALEPRTVQLRAERNGAANRVYTVTAYASDRAGNNTSASFNCVVPVNLAVTGDVNGDGKVDCADVAIIKAHLGQRFGQPGFDPRADLNADGVIDIKDLALVSRNLPAGTQCQ
jgi:hypothetical protein